MSAFPIFFPDDHKSQAAGDDFHWRFTGAPIYAEFTLFRAFLGGTGIDNWVFYGSTGSTDHGTFFALQFLVPYEGDDLLEKTYKIGDGQQLTVFHFHSVPPAPNFTSILADKAELTIRLDPVKGTVHGDFNANFDREGYRMNPIGTFDLKRADQ
ncbi:hypothetical protein IB245_02090 [Pseudomonas sp. PDM02]|uniref:hypothetical protein n=1 Tax=Pseudomonas sp. PDM02 TaxID=2769267 RepID=UPI00177DD800|nr:hypothetical protein [Pseudomonas sp. PDM02]MBD9610285.1 hypothetical protein [Pseudomonas sp. PDM02]